MAHTKIAAGAQFRSGGATPPADTTTATVIFAIVGNIGGDGPQPPEDNFVNDWGTPVFSNGGSVCLYVCEAPIVGAGFTLIAPASHSGNAVAYVAYACDGTPVLSSPVSGVTPSEQTTVQAASAIATNANDLVISAISSFSLSTNTTSYSIDSSFTKDASSNAGASAVIGMAIGSKVEGGSSGTENPTWTIDSNSGMQLVNITYGTGGGGGGGSAIPLIYHLTAMGA